MPTLNWIGKDAVINHHQQVPLRLLECDPSLSAGDPDAGNLLIQGDNLEALKALLPRYKGQVKCIYIDPPYNTGNENWIYNDNVNDPRIKKWLGEVVGKEAEDLCRHDKWLCMMYPRLALLNELLAEDGVLFASINEKELHHLRSILDEIFPPASFLAYITVKTSDPSGHKTVNPAPYDQVEHLLMYAKRRAAYHYTQRYVRSVYDPGYNQFIANRQDPFDRWQTSGLNEAVANRLGYKSTREATKALTREGFMQHVGTFALENSDSVYQATAISDDAGADIVNARDRSTAAPDQILRVPREGYTDVYISGGRQIYFYSSKVRDIDGELGPAKPLTNLWTDIPWNGIAREGGVTLKNGKKPEALLRRCLQLASEPGDLVLDSFGGSATTAAVAQKMDRRWILVEMGDHARTHAQTRLAAVVNGSDDSGISQVERWKGGSGFRFCRLGKTLLDEHGEINQGVPFTDLARYVYLIETGMPAPTRPRKDNPLIGIHEGRAVYLVYNGVLGDKRPAGGNVLTHAVLDSLPPPPPLAPGSAGVPQRVIYGEACRLSDATLARLNIVFRQTPYALREK
jgi:adenine-specific DNA-methyltransferase